MPKTTYSDYQILVDKLKKLREFFNDNAILYEKMTKIIEDLEDEYQIYIYKG